MSSLPTIETITAHFLFGTKTIPDNLTDSKLIRPPISKIKNEDKPEITVDINEFMQGPGRFVLPDDFNFIKYFFAGIPDNLSRNVLHPEVLVLTDSLTPGKYTKQEIFDRFNIKAFEDKTVSKTLGFYDDGKGDLLERAYVWNTSVFMIDDEARFVVTESGERFIENFAMRPYKNPKLGREAETNGSLWRLILVCKGENPIWNGVPKSAPCRNFSNWRPSPLRATMPIVLIPCISGLIRKKIPIFPVPPKLTEYNNDQD